MSRRKSPSSKKKPSCSPGRKLRGGSRCYKLGSAATKKLRGPTESCKYPKNCSPVRRKSPRPVHRSKSPSPVHRPVSPRPARLLHFSGLATPSAVSHSVGTPPLGLALDDILSIYTYNFLGKNRPYVAQMQADNRIRQTKLILPDQDLIDVLDIPQKKYNLQNTLTHLKYRHPIHINGPRYENINQPRMAQVLHYTRQDCDAVDAWTDSSMRYGILGWTPVLQNSHSVAKEAYVLHLWGVNMERKGTTDYKYVFGKTGKFDVGRYLELLAIMMGLVRQSAFRVIQATRKPLVIRITNIGLGVWSSEVPEASKPAIKQAYARHLSELTGVFPALAVYHADYSEGATYKYSGGKKKSSYRLSNHPANRRADPFGPPDFVSSNKTLLVINAWDDRSFIGNGGSFDNSLDGWITAQPLNNTDFSLNYAGMPLGSNFINASYLHNVFFK